MKLAGSEYRRPPGRVEINLAPLIDVMFLLLIFFMVATVFPENEGVSIHKPEMSSAGDVGAGRIVVKVTDGGEYYMEGGRVTLSEAARRVAASKERGVTIEADRGARVELLTDALDAFKQAGAKSLAVAAEKKEAVKR